MMQQAVNHNANQFESIREGVRETMIPMVFCFLQLRAFRHHLHVAAKGVSACYFHLFSTLVDGLNPLCCDWKFYLGNFESNFLEGQRSLTWHVLLHSGVTKMLETVCLYTLLRTNRADNSIPREHFNAVGHKDARLVMHAAGQLHAVSQEQTH